MDQIKEKCKQVIDRYRFQIIGGLIILGVIAVTALIIISSQNRSNQNHVLGNDQQTLAQGKRNFSSRTSGGEHQRTFVDVEGAVKHPGVYQFTENMRVDDAINLAGGLNRSADRKHVDLAKKLSDQQTIYIPVKGEIKTSPVRSDASSGGQSGDSGDDSGKVNLNQANKSKLQSISGIGDKRASKIIDYRQSHGNFKSVADLKKISGIGDKFLANIKSHVTV